MRSTSASKTTLSGTVVMSLRANLDKYDFTEYLDDRTFDGIKFAARRLGYNADAQGKTGPRFSEMLYEEVRWNVSLPESLFAPPR